MINEHDRTHLSRTETNRWALLTVSMLYMLWGLIEFATKQTGQSHYYFTARLSLFLSILFVTLLISGSFYKKFHHYINTTLLTTITASNLYFFLQSNGDYYVLGMIHIAAVMLFISFTYRASFRYFLPIVLTPLFVVIGFEESAIGLPQFMKKLGIIRMSLIGIICGSINFFVNYYINKLEEITTSFTRKKMRSETLLQENQQLIRILCHDLGNALAVIDMSSNIVIKKLKIEQEQVEFFQKNMDRLKRAIHTQREIINDVKEKEALDSGKSHVSLRPVSLNTVFDKVKFIFQDRLEEKDIELNINIGDAESTYVMAEVVSLSNNVINNIISNAIKFSPDGAQIDINTWNDQQYVYVSIQDYGIGMNQELLDNIFSQTAQTSRPGVNGETGTGFGMPLAKTCMAKFNGEIIVESQESKGTRFTLKFHNIQGSDKAIESNQNDFKLVS